ncbi:hypothetical protein [Devosia sp.]|uniref:hypothetical protein n=1 Tax=Devosia sp. TaxID=1871048 RepID=UPI00262D3F53|nr:hypothetical protein [Devosia sp.]
MPAHSGEHAKHNLKALDLTAQDPYLAGSHVNPAFGDDQFALAHPCQQTGRLAASVLSQDEHPGQNEKGGVGYTRSGYPIPPPPDDN